MPFGSFVCALGLVRFKWGRSVRSGITSVWFGSFGVIGVRPGVVACRWVQSGAPRPFLCSLEVIGGPWASCVHSETLGPIECTLGVVGFIWGRSVHSCAHWGSLAG